MPYKHINTGTGPGDEGAERVYDGFVKAREMLKEIYENVPFLVREDIGFQYVGGLQFRVYARSYRVNGIDYNATPTSRVFDLEMSPVDKRWYVFYADTDGNIGVAQGAPAAEPVKPNLSGSQRYIGEVQVNSTEERPINITTEIVFSEGPNGADPDNEWEPIGDGAEIYFTATQGPYAGNRHIRLFPRSQPRQLYFRRETPFVPSSKINMLDFYVKVRTYTETTGFTVGFRQGPSNMGAAKIFSRSVGFGTIGFDPTLVGVWQHVTVNVENELSGKEWDGLYFGINVDTSVDFDEITVSSGSSTAQGPPQVDPKTLQDVTNEGASTDKEITARGFKVTDAPAGYLVGADGSVVDPSEFGGTDIDFADDLESDDNTKALSGRAGTIIKNLFEGKASQEALDAVNSILGRKLESTEAQLLFQAYTKIFTPEEKDKLATYDSNLDLGGYETLEEAEIQNPNIRPGSRVYIDQGVGVDAKIYHWDATDGKFVLFGSGGVETPASIYTKLFQNADVFPFDTAAKNALNAALQIGSIVNSLTSDEAEKTLGADQGPQIINKIAASLQNAKDYVDSTYRADEINLSSISAVNAVAPLALPTYDGTTQGTHPCVISFEQSWNGYKYWMAYTPYTNGDPDFENPAILASNDKETWIVPSGLINPIQPKPTDGTYWADTHLVYDEENDRLICYYRGFEVDRSFYNVYAQTSSNGSVWTQKTKVIEVTEGGGSPVVIKDSGLWTMYDIDFINIPSRIFKRTSADPLNFQNATRIQCTYEGMPPGKDIWHFDIKKVRGYLYCVMMDTSFGANGRVGGAVFGIVKDDHFTFPGYEFLSRETSGWTQVQLYRGSFLPYEIGREGIGFDLWYGGVDVSGKWQIGKTTFQTYFSSFSVNIGKRNGDYILKPQDNQFSLESTSLNDQQFTIPNYADQKIPVGFEVDLLQGNSGKIIPKAGSGVVLRYKEGVDLKSEGVNSLLNLKKIALNIWLLTGGLTPEQFLRKINAANIQGLTTTRSSIATFMDLNGVIKTAIADELRIDSSSGIDLILIEEADSNKLTYSADFDNASWVSNGITVTKSTLNLPSGDLGLSKLKGDDFKSIFKSFTKAASKKKYNLRMMAKKEDSKMVYFLVLGASAASRLNCSYYPDSDLISFQEYGDFQVNSFQVKSLKNDLVIVNVEFTTDASAEMGVRIYDRSANPNGINLVYAQVTDKFSSYIPTTNAAVSRAADVVTIASPAGTNKIIERIAGKEEKTITTIPGTYQLPLGSIESILFK